MIIEAILKAKYPDIKSVDSYTNTIVWDLSKATPDEVKKSAASELADWMRHAAINATMYELAYAIYMEQKGDKSYLDAWVAKIDGVKTKYPDPKEIKA